MDVTDICSLIFSAGDTVVVGSVLFLGQCMFSPGSLRVLFGSPWFSLVPGCSVGVYVQGVALPRPFNSSERLQLEAETSSSVRSRFSIKRWIHDGWFLHAVIPQTSKMFLIATQHPTRLAQQDSAREKHSGRHGFFDRLHSCCQVNEASPAAG